MCDFSYIKECVSELKAKTTQYIPKSSEKEQFDLLFAAIDSQIISLENYIQNESRKKVSAEEKVQTLESQLLEEREKRKLLEQFGVCDYLYRLIILGDA